MRLVHFERKDNGLSVVDVVPTSDLPADAIRIDLVNGGNYNFNLDAHRRMREQFSRLVRGISDAEAQQDVIAACFDLWDRSIVDTCPGVYSMSSIVDDDLTYVYGYHGKGLPKRMDRALGLRATGGFDNDADCLRLWRANNPQAASRESCDDPAVSEDYKSFFG